MVTTTTERFFMNTVTSYQDLLDRDHAALVAECKRIDDELVDELVATAIATIERNARRHVASVHRFEREQEDALWGMSMPVARDVIMGW
jgi:hypothetical protein